MAKRLYKRGGNDIDDNTTDESWSTNDNLNNAFIHDTTTTTSESADTYGERIEENFNLNDDDDDDRGQDLGDIRGGKKKS